MENTIALESESPTVLDRLVGPPSYKLFQPLLSQFCDQEILELGSGSGRFTRFFHRNNRCTCLDLYPSSLKLSGIQIIQGDASELHRCLPQDKKYNLILSFFMSEYLGPEQLSKCLRDSKSFLLPHGRIYFTFISKGILGLLYVWAARLIRGRKKYYYSYSQVQKMATAAGLQVVSKSEIKSFGMSFAHFVEFVTEQK